MLRRIPRGLVGALAVAVLVPVASPFAAAPRTPRPLGTAQIGLTKTASVATLQPGQDVEYRLTASCSSLTEDCANLTITDTLPAGLDVTALPSSNNLRDVVYDDSTRTLTITYKVPISGGGSGLLAGSSQAVSIGMRLPQETPIADGVVIPNTATVTADNAASDTAEADVTTSIPVVLRPVATKQWSPAAAIAQSGASSTITLGARNASTNSAQVRELVVEDTTGATFDRFDLTNAGTLDRFPVGADQVVVDVCTKDIGDPCADGEWVSSAPQSGALPLVLSADGGVNLGDVTGVRYRFSDSGGGTLAYDPDDARVALAVELRDTLRSTGAVLNPVSAQRITNCATPSLTDAVPTTATGGAACVPFTIQPGNSSTVASKAIFADNNGDFAPDGLIVVGQDSGVSMRITGTNASAFNVPIMRISEPSASAINEFSKISVTRARITAPAGATQARLTVTCRSGADPAVVVRSVPPTVATVTDLGCETGIAPASVTVEFRGADPITSEPRIVPSALGALELHGNATGVDESDVSDGLLNCASTFVAANIDSTGSATSDACATATVANPRPGVGGGSKTTNGVSTIVAGQRLDFDLSFRNTGNIPVANAVLADPPDPTVATNPFNIVRLTDLRAISASPASVLEVYDPLVAGYVAYDASNSALLLRAKGIRVRVTGNVAVNQSFQVRYSVLLRDGQPDGVTFNNCASVGINTPTTSPFCNSTSITSESPRSGASLNKVISPATVLRPQIGLPAQVVTVKHRLQNTGNLYLNRLQVTDIDNDFFDAVIFRGQIAVNFPLGADRVRVDVCTSTANCNAGTFVNGTPTSSSTPPIPVGVTTANVKGIRVTFTNANGGYEILPAPNFPSGGSCPNATVCFLAEIRETLASSPSTLVPSTLVNTSGGLGESQLQPIGTGFVIPNVSASVSVETGTPALTLDKSPNSRIGPGDTAPFTLVTTNSGTNAVADPTVVDPLPSGLTFEPSYPGAPTGQPYSLTYALPSGAATPSTVDFTAVLGDPVAPPVAGCTDVNRVCKLVWSFPGWTLPPGGRVTIAYNVRLSAGVLAGQTLTNTAGATGSNPDLRCDTTTQRVDDADYGAGRFCVDSATVTTLAGDNFTGEKWIAADPALGLLDASGAIVAVGDPTCPRFTVGAITYTRYPCTARVLPGHEIDFLIRGVNSGTNPATKIVVVDGLPVRGDRGVWINSQSRGTEWDRRPTMLTAVSSTGVAGQSETDYTNAAFGGAAFCTSNLRPPPNDSCPATAFDDAFGASNTGFRTTLTYPPGDLLLPGESFSLTWKMQAPASVTSNADEPIAWNSFAYRPTFKLPSGASNTLPATEPLKVGVSMPLGSFTVTKNVVGLPDGVTTAPFEAEFRCTVDLVDGSTVEVEHDTFTLIAGEVFVSPNVPQGATCSVWETNSRGGDSDNVGEANAVVVTIDQATGPQTVELTNAYNTGSLTISKRVTWDGVPPITLPGPFGFDIECAFPDLSNPLPGYPQHVDLADGESATFDQLPVGAPCLVTETERQGAMLTNWTPSIGEPSDGASALIVVDRAADGGTTIDVENVYTTGAVEITKQLTGDASGWSQGPYDVTVTCVDPAGVLPDVVGFVTLRPNDLSETVSPIPSGYQCSVTETDPGDAASFTVEPAGPITIPPYTTTPPGPVQVVVTNDYPAGHVAVSKVLTGDGASMVQDARFAVRVQCERDLIDSAGVEPILDSTISIRGGETTTLPDALPLGARCWATETDSVGATSSSVSNGPNNKVTITGTTPDVTITATNRYDTTTVEFAKSVQGSGPSMRFGFSLQCTLGDGDNTVVVDLSDQSTSDAPTGMAATAGVFRAGAGDRAVFTVPRGARCTADEFDSGDPLQTDYVLDGQPLASSTFVVTDAVTAEVAVTNVFAERLPYTGSDSNRWVVLALVLLGVGLVGGVLGRRRIGAARSN